ARNPWLLITMPIYIGQFLSLGILILVMAIVPARSLGAYPNLGLQLLLSGPCVISIIEAMLLWKKVNLRTGHVNRFAATFERGLSTLAILLFTVALMGSALEHTISEVSASLETFAHHPPFFPKIYPTVEVPFGPSIVIPML